MTALDTMKSALQCSKTEAAKLRIRVRQLEEKLVEVAAIGEQEADKLRQGSEFLVAENARMVAANTRLTEESERLNSALEKWKAYTNGGPERLKALADALADAIEAYTLACGYPPQETWLAALRAAGRLVADAPRGAK